MSFAQHFFTIVNMCSGARRCLDAGTHSLYSSPQPSYLISTYHTHDNISSYAS